MRTSLLLQLRTSATATAERTAVQERPDVFNLRCRLCYGYAFMFTWRDLGITIACRNCGEKIILSDAAYCEPKDYPGYVDAAHKMFWATLTIH